MSISGIFGASQFCMHPSKLTAYILDPSNDCFVIIDLNIGERVAELKCDPFHAITGYTIRFGIQCIERTELEYLNEEGIRRSRELIIAGVLEKRTSKCFLVLFEINAERSAAEVIEVHDIGVQEIFSESIGSLFHDEKGDLYFINYKKNSEQRKTLYQVVKVEIDHSCKVFSKPILFSAAIDDLCSCPFIFDSRIIFFIGTTNNSQTISVRMNDSMAEKQYAVIAPNMSQDIVDKNSGKYTPNGSCSNRFLRNNTMYWYFFNRSKKTGELWALDLKAMQWHMCFEFSAHAIKSSARIFVTSEERLLLHGDCADENCSEKAHLFHFGTRLVDKMIYPTTSQLGAFLSTTKIQIFYGPKASGKTLLLLLKAINAVGTCNSTSDSDKIKIFVPSNEKRTYFINAFLSHFGASYNSGNILLLSENNYETEQFNGCSIFVDGVSALSFRQKQFLLCRPGTAIVTIADYANIFGLDHPRTDSISWHNLQSNEQMSKSESASPHKEKELEEVSIFDQSMEAMDQFYAGWWDYHLPKQTICIPASQDVFSGRYFGPIDENATGFKKKVFDKKTNLIRGQAAEQELLVAFQKLEIGGIFISGFNSVEFSKVLTSYETFKTFKIIKEFEVDAIFIHPLMGVFAFEVKAKEGTKLQKPLGEAYQQLENINEKLLEIYEYLCGQKCTIPLYFAPCFPNAEVKGGAMKKNFFILDKSLLMNELRSFMIDKMTWKPKADHEQISLKKFAAVIAGYRSMDFFSAGHNALVVHKIINSQNIQNEKAETHKDNIFLTNEQLAIFDCQEQYQVISGPPGTGKTLILLRKALVAAQTKTKGNIHVIAGRPELQFKFQKYFEKHISSIICFPIVELEVYESLSNYANEDDIFVDETFLTELSRFKERLSMSGKTVIVLTGLFNPPQAKDVKNLLVEHDMTGFRHFPMTTVIRSSKTIFDEWKNDYDTGSNPIHIGHNINGTVVRRIIRQNSSDILNAVLEIIQSLFKTGKNSKTDQIALGNLCVIVGRAETCSLIKNFLSGYRIPCGSVDEQIQNPNIAAVCSFEQTVSQEWPIVIVVSMIDITCHSRFLLMAASRCISKMIIVERDIVDVMKKIDEKMELLRAAGSINNFDKFYTAVIFVEQEIGETEMFIVKTDFVYQLIRQKVVFEQLEKHEAFANCHALFDCWQRVADRPAIGRYLLAQNIIGTNLPWTMVPRSDTPSKLFARITADSWTKEEMERYWMVLQRLVRKLIEIMEEDKNGYKPTPTEMAEIRLIVEGMKTSSREWAVLHNSIHFLAGL